MNELPCGKCTHYDPILKSNEEESKRGWCIKRSKYPAREGPGQVFPATAERLANPKALGEPFIVKKDGVIESCAFARPSRVDTVAQKRDAQSKKDAQGKRVLT